MEVLGSRYSLFPTRPSVGLIQGCVDAGLLVATSHLPALPGPGEILLQNNPTVGWGRALCH
jgi:hypothetical protein